MESKKDLENTLIEILKETNNLRSNEFFEKVKKKIESQGETISKVTFLRKLRNLVAHNQIIREDVKNSEAILLDNIDKRQIRYKLASAKESAIEIIEKALLSKNASIRDRALMEIQANYWRYELSPKSISLVTSKILENKNESTKEIGLHILRAYLLKGTIPDRLKEIKIILKKEFENKLHNTLDHQGVKIISQLIEILGILEDNYLVEGLIKIAERPEDLEKIKNQLNWLSAKVISENDSRLLEVQIFGKPESSKIIQDIRTTAFSMTKAFATNIESTSKILQKSVNKN